MKERMLTQIVTALKKALNCIPRLKSRLTGVWDGIQAINGFKLVRNGEAVFPLFDDWVQYGEVQFWVVGINKNRIQGPESTELVRKIYVTVTTGVGMRLLGYYWDKQNLCYEKEVIFNPEDQWVMRHSNKYSIPDPYRIAPEQILEGK